MPDTPHNRRLAAALGQEMVPMESELVAFVDSLLEFAKHRASPDGMIETEGDWEVVDRIVRGFEVMFPETAKDFFKRLDQRRRDQKNKYAVAEESGGFMRHHLEIPQPLFRLLGVMYPKIQWSDKKFVRKFETRVPKYRVTESL